MVRISRISSGFAGEAAEYYSRYRRGYPDPVIDALQSALGLSSTDTVLDLGCGTGQLSLPLARRVARVIGVDPEPDMLDRATAAAVDAGAENLEWIDRSADDLGPIAARYGGVDAITLANAIHLVDRARLFYAARTALRPGRGLAIIANGTPLWLHPTAWSHALRGLLEGWLETTLTSHCGTDDETRAHYRDQLIADGYRVDEVQVDYSGNLTIDEITGGVFSAMSDQIPSMSDRAHFATTLQRALANTRPYVEHVSVRTLIAHVR
jgi:SAM-dependent methyltransferase